MSRSAEAAPTQPGEEQLPSIRDGAAVAAATLSPILAARLVHLAGSPMVLAFVASGVVVFAVGLLRPRWLLIALLVAIGARSGSELANMTPASTQPLDRVDAVLIDDPRPTAFGWRAVADVDGVRVHLSGPFGEPPEAGDRLVISGTQRGQVPGSEWAVSKRLVGAVSASTVHSVDSAGGAVGMANHVRSSIRDGAGSLSASRRVLFTGLVFGDDRGQDVIVSDNFRAAGLGHLLAVSGQNVVFVLLLAAPLLTRIRSIPLRVLLTIGALVAFGFLTRFEASVTRALVMAGVAVLAHAVGRPAQAPAVLPPAVAGLLLFDPLLAWSLAFQLSVAATLGLIVLAPRIVAMLPGPLLVRYAVGATLAAQIFVSPLLFSSFGRVSVVAVPANLLAAPAAAGTMMWGLVAGPIAGLSPPWLAALVHIPTRCMLWWIDGVAAAFARLGTGHFTALHLGAGITAVAAVRLRRSPRWIWFAVLAAVAVPTFATPKPLPPGRHSLADGVEVVRSTRGHDIVILAPSAQGDELIESLRHARLGRIDLVIATSGSRPMGRLVSLLDRRFAVVDIWAPAGHQVPLARVVEPFAGRVGTLVISQSPEGDVEMWEVGA